jgi:acetoacetyl-CoA synthetase
LLDSKLIYAGSYTTVVDETLPIDAIPRWFDGITMNFAENLLYSRVTDIAHDHRGTVGKEDGVVAVTEIREGNTEVRHYTWAEVRKEAGLLASAMQASGIGLGDRVILVGSNCFKSLLVFLATAWIGSVFSSSSTDMGTKGILERSVQINPKVCRVERKGHKDKKRN